MSRPESTVQNLTRNDHCKLTNGTIWRNNSGAGRIVGDDGVERMVRWGLANESKQENAVIKSSDLIGITPEYLYHPIQGWRWFGIFTAYECKPEGWRLRPSDKRGLAQQRFIDIVRSVGGYGGFVTDPADMRGIIGR